MPALVVKRDRPPFSHIISKVNANSLKKDILKKSYVISYDFMLKSEQNMAGECFRHLIEA